jgi:hypothetical protein
MGARGGRPYVLHRKGALRSEVGDDMLPWRLSSHLMVIEAVAMHWVMVGRAGGGAATGGISPRDRNSHPERWDR